MKERQYFDLYFEKIKEGQPLHTPISAIQLIHGLSAHNDFIKNLLTSDCVSAKEIADYADSMINELQQIKNEAERKYKKEDKKYI